MNITRSGIYSILGHSTIEIYGYIYENSFNPYNPFENLLLENGVSCGDRQFLFKTMLQAGGKYILVVTTYSPNEIGNYSILASGPDTVILTNISKYIYTV